MNIIKIKKARKLLGHEIQENMNAQGTKEYSLLCGSAGALDILIGRLEKHIQRIERR